MTVPLLVSVLVLRHAAPQPSDCGKVLYLRSAGWLSERSRQRHNWCLAHGTALGKAAGLQRLYWPHTVPWWVFFRPVKRPQVVLGENSLLVLRQAFSCTPLVPTCLLKNSDLIQSTEQCRLFEKHTAAPRYWGIPMALAFPEPEVFASVLQRSVHFPTCTIRFWNWATYRFKAGWPSWFLYSV